jgi:serine-type D-Ala-D-Ala carboxypeptidase/endopeptidase
MLNYLQAHLTEETTELQASMRLATEKRRPADTVNTSMGLGWHIVSENAVDIITHNGGTGGSASYAAMLKPSRVAVIVFSNSSASVDGLGRRVLYLIDRFARQQRR